MEDSVRDNRMRTAAFERVRALCESHGHLTAQQLGEGFYVDGQRYPLVNPRRGIFKPAQMRFLLSINTVFPKTGNHVWYDDQREVHRQIFDGDQMVDYAFMGENPDAPDNRWLKDAFENKFRSFIFWGSRRDDIRPSFRPSSEVGIGHHGALRSASASLNKAASRRPRRTLNADTH